MGQVKRMTRTARGALVVLVLVLAGCAGSDDEQTSGTEPDATQSTSETTSSSSSTSSSSTIPSSAPEPYAGDASTLVGRWTDQRGGRFHFMADGRYTVNDGEYEQGTYQFDGETLVLSAAEDSRYCGGDVATYRVAFYDGGALADLEGIDDPCSPRRQSLARGPIERDRP